MKVDDNFANFMKYIMMIRHVHSFKNSNVSDNTKSLKTLECELCIIYRVILRAIT